MRIDKPSEQCLSLIYRYLNARASRGNDPAFVSYLRIGTQTLRLVSYAADFEWHVHNQLEYVLLDEPSDYDATFVIWQEEDFAALVKDLYTVDKTSELYRRYRIDQVRGAHADFSYFSVFDEDIIHGKPLMEIHASGNQLVGWNPRTNTYYYAVKDLTPEELIKRGHLFVRLFAPSLVCQHKQTRNHRCKTRPPYSRISKSRDGSHHALRQVCTCIIIDRPNHQRPLVPRALERMRRRQLAVIIKHIGLYTPYIRQRIRLFCAQQIW